MWSARRQSVTFIKYYFRCKTHTLNTPDFQIRGFHVELYKDGFFVTDASDPSKSWHEVSSTFVVYLPWPQ